MLELLDQLSERHEKDIEALTHVANEIVYRDGFLQHFVPNQQCAKGQPFLINRRGLAAFLLLSAFERWQQANWMQTEEFATLQDAPAEAIVLRHLSPTEIDAKLCDPKWMRIVDLAIEDAGFQTIQPPRSSASYDRIVIRLDISLLVSIMRSARFRSWSEAAWAQPESLAKMRELIGS